MKRKFKHLKISILLVLVLTATLFTSDSYAYWAADVNSSNNNTTALITTGSWNQIYEWSKDATYNVGDLVYSRDYSSSSIEIKIWISLKASNANKEPSLSKPGSNWWVPYSG